MTKSEIKLLAQKKCGYAGDGQDLDALLNERIQRFCLEDHFAFRKRSSFFNTVAGTASYDLMDSAGANARDIDEIEFVYVVDGSGKLSDPLPPIFSPDAQAQAIENTEHKEPSGYFRDLAGEWNLRFEYPVDITRKIRFTYWAVPNPVADDTSDEVPLVPARFHFALVSGLKMDIRAIQVGSDSPKYLEAVNEYKADVAKVSAKKDWTTDSVISYAANDAVTS